MIRYIASFIFLLIISTECHAQSIMDPSIVYVEVGGFSPHYTVNYERVFNRKGSFDKSFRGGLGVAKNVLAIPISMQFIKNFAPKGRNHPHNLVLSFGPTISIENFKEFSGNQAIDRADTLIYLFGGMGYRYSAPKQLLFFQVSLNPYLLFDITATNLDTNTNFKVAGGAAVGVRF